MIYLCQNTSGKFRKNNSFSVIHDDLIEFVTELHRYSRKFKYTFFKSLNTSPIFYKFGKVLWTLRYSDILNSTQILRYLICRNSFENPPKFQLVINKTELRCVIVFIHISRFHQHPNHYPVYIYFSICLVILIL